MLFHAAWLDPTSARNSENSQTNRGNQFQISQRSILLEGKICWYAGHGRLYEECPDAARAGFNEGVSDVASEINKTSSDNSDSETGEKKKSGLKNREGGKARPRRLLEFLHIFWLLAAACSDLTDASRPQQPKIAISLREFLRTQNFAQTFFESEKTLYLFVKISPTTLQ